MPNAFFILSFGSRARLMSILPLSSTSTSFSCNLLQTDYRYHFSTFLSTWNHSNVMFTEVKLSRLQLLKSS